MEYRISIVTAFVLTLTIGCGPIENNNTDPRVAQAVYDPALCGRSDLTEDLSDPSVYWSFDSAIEADVGTAQVSASGGLSADSGVLFFDGEDDYLTATGIDKPEEFTLSFFAAPSSRSEGGQRMLVNLGNGPGSWQGFGVSTREGSLRFFAEGGGGESKEVTARADVLLPVDDWTHILAVKRGNTLRIFLNGELAAQRTDFDYQLDYGSNELVFGRHSYFESKYFHGRLDEFAMWDSGFSPDDVTTLTTNLAACE